MEIIKADERIKYMHTCERCHSQIAIYPKDVKDCPFDMIPSTLNRRIHTACPVCGSHLVIYLDDTPCFFKQWMARLRSWRYNN